ncbi:hypothetical protein K501DRAFT_231678 [Backusella circina FSU 941]|nr:hypothetical protein K501DRAFT_231678 [Backusella circina FSU 941]
MSSKSTDSSASKKIRMTMACERCRSKIVKCDFTHPQCARCQQAKVDCSYDGSSTQIDLFNLVKLNETVDILQKRVQSIESDIKDVCSNTQYVANEVRAGRTFNDDASEVSASSSSKDKGKQIQITDHQSGKKIQGLIGPSNSQWSLSLTPKGLSVDTNIISLPDLYDILLNGVSHFDLASSLGCVHEECSSQSSSNSSFIDGSKVDTVTVSRRKPLWKTKLKTFPLYSVWEPPYGQQKRDASRSPETLPREIIEQLIDIFTTCFLCLPYSDPENSIMARYKKGIIDPLLLNAVLAWSSRHAAVFHGTFSGRDPNEVGQAYFEKAQKLVKDRFMKTSVDTMHSLLIMYIYAIGMPSDQKENVESEAYIYLGLAIRMCLDLRMNQETKSTNQHAKELNRRSFWVLYFLETLGATHSDKPFSLPPKNMITVDFPTVLENEMTGESRYRVEFIIQRFKITRIYRDIIYKTTEEKPFLSQISAIDRELQAWYLSLPTYFRFEPGDLHKRKWDSTSFREQACIKLNFEYNFQLCQLYGLFFSKTGDQEQLSTIEVLSRDTCLKAASNTVELLECWVQLKQLWCHFTLENLMMAATIYNNILTQSNDDEREVAKKNLEKMAKLLIASPVKHHKYVLSLVKRIQTIFCEKLGIELILDIPNIIQEEEEEEEKEETQSSSKQQQVDQVNVAPVPHAISTINNNVQPVPLNFPSQRSLPFDVLDVTPGPSVFDMRKASNFTEELQFSDFVYTPTLLGYNAMPTINQFNGKRPQYTPEDTFGPNNRFSPHPQNTTSPYHPYGYNNKPSSSTAPPLPSSSTTHISYSDQSSSPQPWLSMDSSIVSSNQPVMLNNPAMGIPSSSRPFNNEQHPPIKQEGYYESQNYNGSYY